MKIACSRFKRTRYFFESKEKSFCEGADCWGREINRLEPLYLTKLPRGNFERVPRVPLQKRKPPEWVVQLSTNSDYGARRKSASGLSHKIAVGQF